MQSEELSGMTDCARQKADQSVGKSRASRCCMKPPSKNRAPPLKPVIVESRFTKLKPRMYVASAQGQGLK